MWNLFFLPEGRSRMRVCFFVFFFFFFFFFFFSRGDRIDPVVLECCESAHSNGNENVIVPFLSDQKNWRAPRPPPTLIIFPKSADQNTEIAILFSVVEKPYNWGLGALQFFGHLKRGLELFISVRMSPLATF